MTTAEVTAKVIEIVKDELFHMPPHMVTEGALLVEDLGADDLDVIEIQMALENEFEIEIPDHEAEACRTVADVVALIEKLTDEP